MSKIEFNKTRYRGCTGFTNWFWEMTVGGMVSAISIEACRHGTKVVSGYAVRNDMNHSISFFACNGNPRAAFKVAKAFAVAQIGGR